MSEQILKASYGAPDRPLKIGEIEIPCYVLEDGKRVIVQRGLLKALGITRGSSNTEKYKDFGAGARLAVFLDQNGLMSLKDIELDVVLKNPIKFIVNKTVYYGYEATVLQEIVRAVSKAFLKGQLPDRHLEIGANAELLDDAFAKVGITALVDEATGYQEVRERDELQQILKAYISPELLPWTKRFPDEFYKELFRLNGWAYNPKSVKRPGIIGKWTTEFVYDQLPDGVVTELKTNTPKSKAGNYIARFHQSLTIDIGEPHLEKQLISVITLMNVSANMRKFVQLFRRKFPPKEGTQLQLESFDDSDD